MPVQPAVTRRRVMRVTGLPGIITAAPLRAAAETVGMGLEVTAVSLARPKEAQGQAVRALGA